MEECMWPWALLTHLLGAKQERVGALASHRRGEQTLDTALSHLYPHITPDRVGRPKETPSAVSMSFSSQFCHNVSCSSLQLPKQERKYLKLR